MKKLAISIVIPALNEAKYLPACLEKLLPQLQTGDEIIVVDNGSTDETADIAASFGVRVVEESIRGNSHARNRGVKVAINNYIARTDADTVVAKEWLESIRQHYDVTNPTPVITGPVYLREPRPLRLGVHSGVTKRSLGYQNALGGNMAFTRQAWEKVLPYLRNDDQKFSEDTELSIEWHRQGIVIEMIPQMVVYTSWRWMIRHPRRSWQEWQRKSRQTYALDKEK